MYIFDTLQHAVDAMTGAIDGLLKFTEEEETTPTPLNENDILTDVGMSNTYILTEVSLKTLTQCFNVQVDTNANLFSKMFVGMSMHSNPIDSCIDLFAMPIDAEDFCECEWETIDFNPLIQDPIEDNNNEGEHHND